MAYINFKEERFVANNQLDHRRINNDKVKKFIENNRDIIKYDEKYSFKVIKNKVLNNTKVQKEDDFLEVRNKKIVCGEFINCKFYNIKFNECTFIGCVFRNCDFSGGGVVFEKCTFIKAESYKIPSLNMKDNLSCEFIKCNMYVKFEQSNISYCIFDQSIIKNSDFHLSNMASIIIANSELNMIKIGDVDLCGAKIYSCYIEDLEFYDKFKSKLDEKTFFDFIKLKIKNREEAEGIYMVYETLANKFKENNLNNNFGEFYYLCKCVERKSLKPLQKFTSYIAWFTSGYGERVVAPLLASIVLIFIFAIIYLIVGIELDNELIRITINTIRTSDLKTFLHYANEATTLSIAMFAGVGIVSAAPIEEAYFISNLETVIGVIMMGIGIGTLTRKIIR